MLYLSESVTNKQKTNQQTKKQWFLAVVIHSAWELRDWWSEKPSPRRCYLTARNQAFMSNISKRWRVRANTGSFFKVLMVQIAFIVIPCISWIKWSWLSFTWLLKRILKEDKSKKWSRETWISDSARWRVCF